ncbi:MAG: ribosome-associated translation inhibitor RaiA [Phycisphaerales bacterium]|nr:ribosome-associated translation inhibitor RaiA [Phycisphaerales bacterium]
MRIDITGKHLDITPAIRTYAESKATKLTKYFDGTQQVRIILESPAGKAKEFTVEVQVDVVKHQDFISHSHGHDLYHCIDECIEKAARQLKDFKEKLRS